MKILYETTHFYIQVPDRPHVTRTDGGHVVIHARKRVVHRWEFDSARASALMRLSMLAGEAFLSGMNDQGIPVERINFQDNGNWAIDRPGQGPHFHLHIYGRARGSQFQKHGEALLFPDRDSDYWKTADLEPLTEKDCGAVRDQIHRLLREERYQLSQWGLTED